MRNIALKVILRLLQFTQKETRADSIQGKQRFLEDFGPGEDASDDEELTERGKRVKQQQPAEHQALFHGNCDDHFRIGMKITRYGQATPRTNYVNASLLLLDTDTLVAACVTHMASHVAIPICLQCGTCIAKHVWH